MLKYLKKSFLKPCNLSLYFCNNFISNKLISNNIITKNISISRGEDRGMYLCVESFDSLFKYGFKKLHFSFCNV